MCFFKLFFVKNEGLLSRCQASMREVSLWQIHTLFCASVKVCCGTLDLLSLFWYYG